jgi:SAM-dependent methyltransferase
LILAPFVAFILAFPVQVTQNSDQILYFTAVRPTGAPAWVTLPVIFVAVAAVMMCLGEGVGRLFPSFPALTAYRLDLVGSLAGIAAFTVLSFLGAPPVGWGLIAAVGFVALHRRAIPRVAGAALVVLVLLLGVESVLPGLSWSPYYKIHVQGHADRISISVNGIPHQTIRDVAKPSLRGLRDVPYKRTPGNRLRHVLIVGAGNGNDVAVALARGAKSVDAVEIDPRIAEIGRQRHPDHPYQNPRVHLVVDDGRAFLQRTKTHYDLVLFALPDSLTLVSGNSSLRLESYLFTAEAVGVAKSHLARGGAFAMYNSYRKTWLIDRYGETLAEAFGHPPCLDSVGGGSRRGALVVALDAADQHCVGTWRSSTAGGAPTPATDDHPFPYLLHRGIPSYYLGVLLAVLLCALVGVRSVAGPLKWMRPYSDLFFMGAAFLLLETRYVTGFALLFGSTWLVNAIVFAGVLVAVLCAVETSRKLRLRSLTPLYALLAVSLIVAYAVPLSTLLALSTPVRLVAAIALAFAPIFCANLIFAARFADTSGSTAAFGANLLGALLGGTLEYASLIVGYRALLILAAVLYLVAFVLKPRRALATGQRGRLA